MIGLPIFLNRLQGMGIKNSTKHKNALNISAKGKMQWIFGLHNDGEKRKSLYGIVWCDRFLDHFSVPLLNDLIRIHCNWATTDGFILELRGLFHSVKCNKL